MIILLIGNYNKIVLSMICTTDKNVNMLCLILILSYVPTPDSQTLLIFIYLQMYFGCDLAPSSQTVGSLLRHTHSGWQSWTEK
jgi:hypothetical protein